MLNLNGQTKRYQVKSAMTGARIFDLLSRDTGIDKEHLRITSGYKEIIYCNKTYEFNNEETLMIKLRLLGGSTRSNGLRQTADDPNIDN